MILESSFDHSLSAFAYSDNTNLEEVSDWLSKIIVGLTLIKIRTIIGWIDQSARSIQHSYHMCNGDSSSFYVFGYGIIILYFLAGGGIIYLWARTNLGLILTESRKKQAEMQKSQQAITSLQAIANPEMNINNDGRSVQIHEALLALGDEARNFPTEEFKNKTESIYNAKPVVDKTDIQNGRWGGIAKANDKVLEATYDPAASTNGIYKIILKVRSTNTEKPLTGQVAFFLHDTFPSQIIYTVAVNNLAQVSLMAYEAFVTGARLEDGTELELNLNTVSGFPNDFYWKV
ncbi:MAG: hypothetical protein INR73_02895 [Williamsia sp.]|nr:hypothetical protein [Williamsia sp.]